MWWTVPMGEHPASQPITVASTPLHLGLGATVTMLPPFDGSMDWYERYEASIRDDGVEGRLVSWHEFTSSWDMWEVHPAGAELVICCAGQIRLHQEFPDGSSHTVLLCAGEAAINEPGVWHTADVEDVAAVLFITPGVGTAHRAR